MGKIAAESRELFEKKMQPYKELVNQSFEKEKNLLSLITKDNTGVGYKKILLCEEMIYIASLYMTINNLSVTLLETKNTDSLNEARKILYKKLQKLLMSLLKKDFFLLENLDLPFVY